MYKTIIAVVVFLFVALAVQLFEQDRIQARIVRQEQDAEKAQAAAQAAQPASNIHPTMTPVEDGLVPEEFSVPTGAPKEFRFTVDASRMADVAIAGHFSVSRDRNHGVDVYVFDEDDYSNWLDGNNANALYASGRESMGDIRVRIGKSGRYFLVFRNDSSPASLNVRSDIKMQYQKVTNPS